jgi:MFS family permease
VRARAIAAWTACLGLGLTLGPLFNGLLLEHVGWRWIFLSALVLGAVIAPAGVFVLADSRRARTPPRTAAPPAGLPGAAPPPPA